MAGPVCLHCLHATAFVAVQLAGLLRLCICPLHYLCGSGCFGAGSSHLFMDSLDDSAIAQVAGRGRLRHREIRVINCVQVLTVARRLTSSQSGRPARIVERRMRTSKAGPTSISVALSIWQSLSIATFFWTKECLLVRLPIYR